MHRNREVSDPGSAEAARCVTRTRRPDRCSVRVQAVTEAGVLDTTFHLTPVFVTACRDEPKVLAEDRCSPGDAELTHKAGEG